jgi:hypothetical protein
MYFSSRKTLKWFLINYFSSSSFWLDKPNDESVPYENLSPGTELKYEIISPPKIIKFPTNTWWAFLKTWDQMKAASFCSLSLKGISPHAAYKKQRVSTKFLKTECESCKETCAW